MKNNAIRRLKRDRGLDRLLDTLKRNLDEIVAYGLYLIFLTGFLYLVDMMW